LVHRALYPRFFGASPLEAHEYGSEVRGEAKRVSPGKAEATIRQSLMLKGDY
jgi:hypothetical protein